MPNWPLLVLVVAGVNGRCISECRHFFTDWMRVNARWAHVGEGNGLKAVTHDMNGILRTRKNCVFIDVGAASYGQEGSNDYSDSLIFLHSKQSNHTLFFWRTTIQDSLLFIRKKNMQRVSVYGSPTLPVDAYPIGSIVTMKIDNEKSEKGTGLESASCGGVIVAIRKDVDKDVSYEVCHLKDGRIVCCHAHMFCVDKVCYMLNNSKIAHDAKAIRGVTMATLGSVHVISMFTVLRAMKDDDAALLRYLNDMNDHSIISSFNGGSDAAVLPDCMLCYDMRTNAHGDETFYFYLLVYSNKTPYLEEAATMLGVSERVIFSKHNTDPVVPVYGGLKEVVFLIHDLIPGITAYVNSCALSKRRVSTTAALDPTPKKRKRVDDEPSILDVFMGRGAGR